MFGLEHSCGAPHQTGRAIPLQYHAAEDELEKPSMSRSLVNLRTVLAGAGSIFVLLLLLLGLGRSKVAQFIPSSTGGDGSLQNIQNATLGVGIIFTAEFLLIHANGSPRTVPTHLRHQSTFTDGPP